MENPDSQSRDTSAFLDSIIENIPDMVFVKDAKELRFVRFNKAGEELLGAKMADLLGKNDYDFFPKEQADFFTSRDRSVLDNKVLVDIPEEPIDTKFKGKRTLHTKKIPILDSNGNPEYLLGISEDITDKKKMDETLRTIEELKEIDRLKSEFIAVAAHQLRTPLSGVKWAINLLLGSELGPITDEQKKFLLKAYETNDRMIGIVNNLLSVDQIASNKFHYNFTQVDILALLDSVLSEMEPWIMSKNASVKFSERPATLPLISVDEEKLREVFQNLIENAVKYSRAGEAVEIGLAADEHEVRFSIKDKGIGIPKEEQDQVFQRFFRATNAVKIEASGSGIGLYVVKSIIEKHGGRIWFESEPDKGSIFQFTLPIVPAKKVS